MPILSTHELSRNHHRIEYEEDGGIIRNKATGEETPFIQRAGVYFVKLFFPKELVSEHNKASDFARPG